MKKYLGYFILGAVVSAGLVGMYLFAPRPTKMDFSAPEQVDQSARKEIMEKASSCDKFCKERHKDPAYHVIGKLKMAPDGESLRCECWRKKISKGVEI